MKTTRTTLALLALTLCCGCQPRANAPRGSEPAKPAGQPAKSDDSAVPSSVTVYFATKDGAHLEAEARDVLPTKAPAELVKAALEELLKGPSEQAHMNVVPGGVKLRKVTVSGSLATVDLSADFVDKFKGGSNVAALVVYGVVNTATAVDGVKQVQFLFDGQPRDEFGGVLSLAKPLEADPSLLDQGQPVPGERHPGK